MAECFVCLRDDFTNYKGSDISWIYNGYSTDPNGPFEKECYYEFDGVDDFLQAQNSSVFDVTTGDFDIEVEFRTTQSGVGSVRLIDKRGQGALGTQPSYQLSPNTTGSAAWVNTQVEDVSGNTEGAAVGNSIHSATYPNDGNWHTARLTWENATGTVTLFVDGIQVGQESNASMIGQSISTSRLFTVGAANTGAQYFSGDTKSFRFGTETFTPTPTSTTELVGSEGTILDVNGATLVCGLEIPFDESCLFGPNPCFDASDLQPGYYQFEYTHEGVTDTVLLHVGTPEDAGNPVGNAFCYQGLPQGDPDGTTIDLLEYFLGATKYNITYNSGNLDQFQGTLLEISSLPVGQYCFTNFAEKEIPDGFEYSLCEDCSDMEVACIEIVEPLYAGDSRVVDICNNEAEYLFEDYLINNDGIGFFTIVQDNLTAGVLTDTTYTPDLSDAGTSFQIAHILPHPLAANCSGTALITFNVLDCVPPPVCPEETDLGVDIVESVNGSPADAQWADLLTITKTGTYADAGAVATDEVYFSNDDGATWILGSEVKDDDYYVKLSSGFTTTCSGALQTGNHRMTSITLSDGNDIQEAQARSRNNNFTNDWTDITSGDYIQVGGDSAAMIAERYFRFDVRHVLNSGWELHLTRTLFDRGSAGGSCPNGAGPFGVTFYSGNRSGKRKILVRRVITYTGDCTETATIEGEFNPELPDCPETPSGLGFNVVPPTPTGGGGWIQGSVTCSGSVAGSTSDTVQVFFQASGSPGYGNTSFSCGGSYGLDLNENYVFHRIIQFADCPPIILLHNYNAPVGCTTATITCEDDDANSRARAFRQNNPSNLSSDYLQFRRGSGSWQSYTEGQWVYVTGTTTVSFRRVANYNNGCAQTTSTCSTTVSPPTYSLNISCSGNTIIVNGVNMPPGGGYYLYANGVFIDNNITGANFTISYNANYQVKYKYNQYQEISSNTVNCGSSTPPCNDPTVVLGECQILDAGTRMKIPFTTTYITSIGQLNATISPSLNGYMTFNAGAQTGSLEVDPAVPGQTYTFGITATNSCGSDMDSGSCTVGCATLSIGTPVCNFAQNRTYYSVFVSPNQGTPPTSTGGTYIGSSGNQYDFYKSGTSGTVYGDHELACSPVSRAVNCTCTDPVISLNASCGLDTISYSFNVINENQATGSYLVKVNGVTKKTVARTGAGNYSGTIASTQGATNNVTVTVGSVCGGTETSNSVAANCGCNNPSINLNASCSTNQINYSFTVGNEGQASSNYRVFVNGSQVGTITKTGAGSYAGTYGVTPGTNNTVQIKVNSTCGGEVVSNIAAGNCGCPSSSLSISSVSCNSTTQMISFTVNRTNIIGLTITLNGNPVSVSGNNYTEQGQAGSNVINVQGQDSCTGLTLSDTVNYSCGCVEPSLSLTASCNTSGTISYTFNVTNQARVSGNYTILVDGVSAGTKTNTGASSYNGTVSKTFGANYAVRIRATSVCGSTIYSNVINVSCGCPSESISITTTSCNPSNQNVTFAVSSNNATITDYYLNGSPVAGPGTYPGVIGNNVISIEGTGNCTGNVKTDSENVNCTCNTNPTVQINSMNEASGVLVVDFSTTNISSTSQIQFRGNNVLRNVTNLGGGNWRAGFTLIEGTNTVKIDVTNACNTAMDTDTYNYSTCVAPSLTKITEQCDSGYLYVYTNAQNIGHSDIVTTPSSTRYGSGSSLTFRFPYGGGTTINWDISGLTDCGSVGINGTSTICNQSTVTVVDEGCSSIGCADYLFFLDNSSSITNVEFDDMAESVRETIDEIAGSPIDARYAVVKYGDGITTLVGWTSSPTTAKNFTRGAYANCDRLNDEFGNLISAVSGSLSPRAGCNKHIVMFTDAIDRSQNCSLLTPFTNRNTLVSNGWIISVVKYRDPNDSADNAIPKAAANASFSNNAPYNGAVWANSGDPDGSGSKPRRLYIKDSFDGNPVPGLTNDITQSECVLSAYVDGCQFTGSFSWVASGGGVIVSGQGTDTIATNGTGTFTVTVDTGQCNIQKMFTY